VPVRHFDHESMFWAVSYSGLFSFRQSSEVRSQIISYIQAMRSRMWQVLVISDVSGLLRLG